MSEWFKPSTARILTDEKPDRTVFDLAYTTKRYILVRSRPEAPEYKFQQDDGEERLRALVSDPLNIVIPHEALKRHAITRKFGGRITIDLEFEGASGPRTITGTLEARPETVLFFTAVSGSLKACHEMAGKKLGEDMAKFQKRANR
jgi:hypothetical protein